MPTAPAGERFQYSNANYSIAGALIEAVTHAPYEVYVRDHILSPLQMDHSFTSRAAAQSNGLAIGYRYWFGHAVAFADPPYGRSDLPSYLLIASATDMAHYLIAHLNGGRYGDNHVLSSDGIELLHRGVKPSPPDDAYGMGWFDERWSGTRV